MKWKFTGIAVLLISLSGCASTKYYEAEPRDDYEPVIINNVKLADAALIKAGGGMLIVEVNGERIANFAKLLIGIGPDSILIEEGEHRILATVGTDIRIGPTQYQKGHEYLIDYSVRDTGSRKYYHYWVRDLTTEDVVYGKEITKEELQNQDE